MSDSLIPRAAWFPESKRCEHDHSHPISDEKHQKKYISAFSLVCRFGNWSKSVELAARPTRSKWLSIITVGFLGKHRDQSGVLFQQLGLFQRQDFSCNQNCHRRMITAWLQSYKCKKCILKPFDYGLLCDGNLHNNQSYQRKLVCNCSLFCFLLCRISGLRTVSRFARLQPSVLMSNPQNI